MAKTRLVCFDLDDTLIRGLTSVTYLCVANGHRQEMEEIEGRRRGGELHWMDADYLKVRLMEGLSLEDARKAFPQLCAPLDQVGETVGQLQSRGILCLLVTSGPVQVARFAGERWGFDAWDGSLYGEQDGKLDGTIVHHIRDGGKIDCLTAYCSRQGIGPKEVVAVGDGATDLPLFAYCGTSIAINYDPAVEGKATHYLHTGTLADILPLIP